MTTFRTFIPDDITAEIYESSRDNIPSTWPKFHDRDTDVWHLTTQTHNGEPVMIPSASDLPPMLRQDVERLYGPLTPA